MVAANLEEFCHPQYSGIDATGITAEPLQCLEKLLVFENADNEMGKKNECAKL